MALTRNFLKSMSLPDEQISAIIEAHAETVDGLKSVRDQYKADAERAADLEKQIEALKGDGTDWKTKYEAEKAAHDSYKATVAAEKANEGKAQAVRAALKDAGVNRDEFVELLMGRVDLATVEMDGDKIKDTDGLINPLKTAYAGCFGVVQPGGVPPINPPGGSPDPSDLPDDEYYRQIFSKKE